MAVGWRKFHIGDPVIIFPGPYPKELWDRSALVLDYESRGRGHAWYLVHPEGGSEEDLRWVKGKYLGPVDWESIPEMVLRKGILDIKGTPEYKEAARDLGRLDREAEKVRWGLSMDPRFQRIARELINLESGAERMVRERLKEDWAERLREYGIEEGELEEEEVKGIKDIFRQLKESPGVMYPHDIEGYQEEREGLLRERGEVWREKELERFGGSYLEKRDALQQKVWGFFREEEE